MTQPITMAYSAGKTCYFVIHHPDGTVWNKDTQDWEAFDDANWAHYANPFTEQGITGFYSAAYPIPADDLDVLPTEASYQQAGATPIIPDDLPIIGAGQSQGVLLASIQGDYPAASKLSRSASSMRLGIVGSGSTPTVITTDLTESENNLFVGRVIMMTSGDQSGSAAIISAYDGTSKDLTVTGLPAAPDAGDEFVIV